MSKLEILRGRMQSELTWRGASNTLSPTHTQRANVRKRMQTAARLFRIVFGEQVIGCRAREICDISSV